MNRIRLFCLLRRNNLLSARRSPAFEQSVVAKVIMLMGGGCFVIYLILYGTMFAYLAVEEHEPAFVLALMPLLLAIDFGIRFMVQQTPAMMVKPYLLLPMPRNTVVENFLLTSLVSTYNWLWLAFFLPYAIIILAGGSGWWLALSVMVSGMLLMMVNSQFYLTVRTLVGRNILWWVLPIIVYGTYWSLLLVDEKGSQFESVSNAIVAFGNTFWLPITCIVLLFAMFMANRRMQFAFLYEEVARLEKSQSTQIHHISRFTFLEHFGETGEYLKLELKCIFRCKAIRSRFIMSLTLIVVFSAFVAYTSFYDNLIMLNFLCYYCFGIFGMTSLVKIMGPEGNYIDLLMVHRENILSLLRAKYYFHCAILLVPFIVMLPAVITGKFSLLMMVAYMLLSCGLLYFALFQLAVYNKQTLPLDQKITGKGNVENGLQLVFEMIALMLPVALASVLLLAFSEQTAYAVIASIGFVFTVLHPLWLRNVYKRIMQRKYENLEGFHATKT